MNREILFRGKRTDNGEWVYGYPVGWQNEGGDISIVDSRFGACIDESGNLMMLEAPFVTKVDPSTIGQYTGLTDKNGVKIFEGDVLKWDEKEWGCPFFEIVTWNYELFEIRQREWKSFCEVVGNIFDQPELLEENNT